MKTIYEIRYWKFHLILWWEIPWVVILTIRSVSCPSYARCFCHTKWFSCKGRQERSCDSDATFFVVYVHGEKYTWCVNKDKKKVETSVVCCITTKLNGIFCNEQIVTTLLGTYLSDEMNFWFTFTSCRYSVSMDTTLAYGKKREIFFAKIKTKHYKALVRFSL